MRSQGLNYTKLLVFELLGALLHPSHNIPFLHYALINLPGFADNLRGAVRMQTQERAIGNNPRNQVGYFRHLQIEEKHMGAILVTNQIGVPLEFKYTEPVTATRLHKILYGSVLDKYLHESVIRDRLGHEVRSTPMYFIASYDEKEFLGQVAEKEMMAIQRYGIPPGEISGPFNRIREKEAIVELEDEGIFLRLAFSTADETVQLNMTAWLQELSRTMDILEPLDRITSALTSICVDVKRG
jgi:hypothetical protein